MRFLKQKIAHAQTFKSLQQQLLKQTLSSPSPSSSSLSTSCSLAPILRDNLSTAPSSPKKQRRQRTKDNIITPQPIRCTKNIVKNFGRAICTFAISHLATPYLMPLLEQYNISRSSFLAHTHNIKQSVDGLFKFRDLLMVQDQDAEDVVANKTVFQKISEVFIKYFSANWIIHGKIQHKEAHLKFRFKMLRRIQSPELFTYLK